MAAAVVYALSLVKTMREVVLDTETTGLDPAAGHRIVEIGCVELVNHVESGRTFQSYLNPERDMPEEAVAVHGLTLEVLSEHPVFEEVADEFLGFIGESALVIHNAEFDLGFINAELERLGRPPIPMDRAVDTVAVARQKFPGVSASLDALCRRFHIDISARRVHGALKDARLLTRVYLELIGGRQPDLALAGQPVEMSESTERPFLAARPHAPTAEEAEAHGRFVDRLPSPLWRS